MSDVFTPLTPASLSSGASSSTVVPAGVFKPLPSPASVPAAVGAASVPAAATASASCTAKPSVTLQRKGNVVTSIRVQCGCGQVIDINCQY